MRVWLGMLVVLAVGYQLLGRYERWPDGDTGRFYERDNLTGEVHLLKPGEQSGNFLARFLGDSSEPIVATDEKESFFDSYKSRQTASDKYASSNANKRINPDDTTPSRMSQNRPPVPLSKEEVIASSVSLPPVPIAMMATDMEETNTAEEKPFAVRQVDLNRDGLAEEIIQNAVHPDGLLDISIVKNGREIFYGRGKQIRLLTTRNTEGWEDIGLQPAQGKVQIFRYSPKEASYITLK